MHGIPKGIIEKLKSRPKTWLVTGAAGFIGSNLVESLLQLGQKVRGLDNFSTGYQHNLKEISTNITSEQWSNFEFQEGDVRSYSDCEKAALGADFVLHQAALGSVPRSLENPLATNDSNVTGQLNILEVCRRNKIRAVYAASSSTYGDHPGLPKVEPEIGNALSPYAVSKYVNELYAGVFRRCYGLETIGLRYFNVFGPRQDPNGAYAAVIPIWFAALLRGQPVYINGDGYTTRDFSFVGNVVQANILAAMTDNSSLFGQVCNVACGQTTSLIDLFKMIRGEIAKIAPAAIVVEPIHRAARPGDVQQSLADLTRARHALGYEVDTGVDEGIRITAKWYVERIMLRPKA